MDGSFYCTKDAFTFVFVMDPYERLDPECDTSLLLMDEILDRGHRVFWVHLRELYLSGASVRAQVREVHDIRTLELGAPEDAALDEFDAVVGRLDPPFDLNYLHMTYVLDRLGPTVAQFNVARAVRSANEKLLGLRWPDLVPASVTTMNPEYVHDFVAEHGRIVVKPLNDCAGRGVVLLDAQQPDLRRAIDSALHDDAGHPRFVIAQEFLPAISEGDKRVYLAGGEVVGIVNRIPESSERLGNMCQGARAVAGSLTADERALVDTIAPELLAQGLFLVGLDLIGGRITEINVTCPSCLVDINDVSGSRVERRVVELMLEHVLAMRQPPRQVSVGAVLRGSPYYGGASVHVDRTG